MFFELGEGDLSVEVFLLHDHCGTIEGEPTLFLLFVHATLYHLLGYCQQFFLVVATGLEPAMPYGGTL